MMRHILLLLMLAGPAAADTLVAAHTIRAKAILNATDLARSAKDILGGVTDPDTLIGQEARVTLYAGRPIRANDVGPPAIIERNQMVVLTYANSVVTIHTDGRALDRAGVGDRVRAMNLNSRSTIVGTVTEDGRISVLGGPS